MQALRLMLLLKPVLTLPRPRVALLPHQRLSTAALALHAHSAAVSLPKHLDCQHFDQCSGCTVEQVDRPPILEDARAFAAKLGVQDFQFDVGAPHGWRCRARLAVRGRRGDPVIGLYRAGTHDAIDVPHCRVHHPRLNEAVEAIRTIVRRQSITPFSEHNGRGELRYLQLTAIGTQPDKPAAQHDPEASVQVVLVWNAPGGASNATQPRLVELAAQLWREHGPQAGGGSGLVHSVWANFQASRGNTILGPDWHLLHPPQAPAQQQLTYQVFGGAVAAFAPGSFMQVNYDMMDAALAAIQSFVPRGSRVLDLHAGVGVIGLSLAATRQCRWVQAVEVNGQGQLPFEAAVKLLPSCQDSVPAAHSGDSNSGPDTAGGMQQQSSTSPASRLGASSADDGSRFVYTVSTAAAAVAAGAFHGADVICVDPPRKGLEADLLLALATQDAMATAGCSAHTLVYLSCGFASFQRDVEALLAGGAWQLETLRGFEFFPGTNSIESLAVLRRVRSSGGAD